MSIDLDGIKRFVWSFLRFSIHAAPAPRTSRAAAVPAAAFAAVPAPPADTEGFSVTCASALGSCVAGASTSACVTGGVQCFHCCVNIFLCRFRIGIDCCRILICRIECCPGSRSEVIFTVAAVQAQRFIQRALVRQRSRVQTRFTQRAHCRIHCFLISVCVIIYCLCSPASSVGQSLYRRRHVVIQVGRSSL